MRKLIPSLAAITLLCVGCAGASNEASAPSYEEQVTSACNEVQQGANQTNVNNALQNYHWLRAATQFRNMSNQNPAFSDYAEGLNAWATGSASGKIYQVFDFCGTTY